MGAESTATGIPRWMATALGFVLLFAWATFATGEAAAQVAPPTDLPKVEDISGAMPDAAVDIENTVPVPTTESDPDAAAAAYLMKCMGCHTIGGGVRTGPDLKNAAGYPRQTVTDAVKRMEKNVGPLSNAEVEEMVNFLMDPEAAARLQAQQDLASLREAATLEPASPEKGKALFLGRMTFQNGGIACAACHQAGGRGGNLAASLEDAYTRLGEQSLLATAQSPGFPVMRAIYTPQPVTKQEALHLAKFFEEVAATPAPPAKVPLHVAGVAGTVAVMVLLGRSTRKRAAGTRARMVAEAQRRGTCSGQARRGQ